MNTQLHIAAPVSVREPVGRLSFGGTKTSDFIRCGKPERGMVNLARLTIMANVAAIHEQPGDVGGGNV